MPQTHQQDSSRNLVHSLNAIGSSRVQIGNTYNTSHHYQKDAQQDCTKVLEYLGSTDPREDKIRIQQTSGGLLKDCYAWIIDNPEFLAWRDQDRETRLLWVKGDPGKGKTMLLCGIIDELHPSTKLNDPKNRISLAYFFCQATNSGLNNAASVLRGLAYLLVLQQPHLLSHFDGIQQRPTTHSNAWVAIQKRFLEVMADPALRETYFIVDALDECVENLDLLMEIISNPSSRVKWIISSRKCCDIEETLGNEQERYGLSLELNQSLISQAVKNYIDYRIERMKNRKKLEHDVVELVHNHLSQQAQGTFLWVALVCQQLEKSRPWEIRKQLLSFPKDLNLLYQRMMEQIRSSQSYELHTRILAIISTVFRPITFTELMAMHELDPKKHRISDIIADCGSFLTTREKTIYFIHQSAQEFLLKDAEMLLFPSGLAQHHYALFEKSLAILQVLHKDIYHLSHPGVSLEDARRNRPEPDPLASLAYACVFWADHLQTSHRLTVDGKGPATFPDVSKAHSFIAAKFLFWLEALSLCHSLPAATKSLLILSSLPPDASCELDSVVLVEDALRFILFFRPIIENYPLQVYASGLLFSPQKSLIRLRFEQYTPKFIANKPQVDENWGPIWTVYELGSAIRTMTFSPSSQTLVMTMFDGTSEIWNVHDGSVIRRIKHDGVRRMTLSLDLQRLAVITMRNSGGTEQLLEDVLEVQDFNLNKTLWTRKLKKRESLGMKISPDNEWLAVCYRTEVELYALGGSMLRAWPLQLDPNAENCEISFSTDVTLLSLLSYPDSDRVWVFDLRTGSHYKSPELDEVWGITDAKFVPHAHILMISTDEEGIHLWDVFQQECKKWVYCDCGITCLSFSHIGSWVAVGAGETLYIYDRAQRRLLRRVELPNKESLVMITVSPDDLKIAVHAVGRMWLLDVRALLAENWQSNTSEEPTYHLSNNAQLMASVLNTVIEVKDAITGRILSTLDLDKAGWQCTINKLAFSPDGQCIAFSGNKSVIVWNRADDKLQYYDFDDAELIRHLAISPNANSDDQWLAVCGMFGISVWGMTSGDFVRFTRPPDHFFRGEPTFVGFSGSRLGVLWCEYYAEVRAPDATFSLYNIKTGERLSRIDIPWTSSRWPVSRARFSISPNGKLAMSYVPEKKNLLITDLETGTHCVSVHIEAYHFFFVDDNTVSTDQGLFHLTSVIARTMEELAASTDQLVRIDAGTRWTLPTIHPTFETYGRSSNFEWITLDNQPLLWIPPQYRKVRQELMAIGYDHVTVEFSRGMYSIAFEQVARDFVRKARNSLS